MAALMKLLSLLRRPGNWAYEHCLAWLHVILDSRAAVPSGPWQGIQKQHQAACSFSQHQPLTSINSKRSKDLGSRLLKACCRSSLCIVAMFRSKGRTHDVQGSRRERGIFTLPAGPQWQRDARLPGIFPPPAASYPSRAETNYITFKKEMQLSANAAGSRACGTTGS